MALFPPTIVKEDSAQYETEFEDKAIKSDTDGGYVYSRPRHGRNPRRTIKTGFTNLDPEQKAAVEAFFNTHGTYVIFDYYLPDTGELIQARFEGGLTVKYRGFGGTHRYDLHGITLQEV